MGEGAQREWRARQRIVEDGERTVETAERPPRRDHGVLELTVRPIALAVRGGEGGRTEADAPRAGADPQRHDVGVTGDRDGEDMSGNGDRRSPRRRSGGAHQTDLDAGFVTRR